MTLVTPARHRHTGRSSALALALALALVAVVAPFNPRSAPSPATAWWGG